MTKAIPLDQRDGWIWFDGQLVPWREAQVHVLTNGLHYGNGVFEGVRAYSGKVFKARAHSERLIWSAQHINMTIPYTAEQLDAACYAALEKNNLRDAYLRPLAWFGAEHMTPYPFGLSVHVMVAAWPLSPLYANALQKGLGLKQVSWQRPAPHTAAVHAKICGNYVLSNLAKVEAVQAGFDDALLLDYRGFVAESTGTNIFFVKDGALITPKPEAFLSGITRATVIDIARGLGLTVTESDIKPEVMPEMDEAFLTGTMAEITPVHTINNKVYGVGAITKKLQAAYQAAVLAPS